MTSLRLRKDEFFQDEVNDGAKGGMLLCQGRAADEYVFVGVGEAFAIRRADLIDAAVVVGAEEGAGFRLRHIIAFFIEFEIAFDVSRYV